MAPTHRARKPAAAPAIPRPSVSRAPLPPWLRHALRTALHLLLDGVAVAGSFYLAYELRFRSEWWLARFPLPTAETPGWGVYERLLYAFVPLWLAVFWYSCRLYATPWMSATDRFLQIVKGTLIGVGASLAATTIYSRVEYSRMMLLLLLPISIVAVSVAQSVTLWLDSLMARLEAARPVLIIGSVKIAAELKRRIHERHPEADVAELEELPDKPALEAILSARPYYELILLRSSLPHDRVLAAAEACDAHGVGFKMVPDLLELRLGEVQMDHTLGLPAYKIQHSSMTRLNFLAKRCFDLVFSSLLLAALSAPLALICLLIKLDSAGPILFKQKRYGYKGRVFEAYKFRTMVVDAEKRIKEIRAAESAQGAFFKAKDDPRITRVGKWLRRFSLDEFPQFLNVLRGEMSVVGPRPLALTTGELEALERDFGATAKKRMNILPGITGLWQVSGRSDVSSEQRFALDLFYIEHWSLGMDLEIILKTVPAMLMARGAY
jgi:exopolysaccharide biosynthesis polyprenyl glycosylphosphotransferase